MKIMAIGFACGLLLAAVAIAQEEEGTTPGAIANPGSYQGSMQLQQQEQQQYQQQQQQNNQMQERLDQNYQQYAPAQAGGNVQGRAAPQVNWWNQAPLPPERNPLLGRWQQTASKGVSSQDAAGSMGGLLPAGVGDMVAGVVNSSLAGGCKSIFGTGVVAFEPTALQWVAPDGHEEILNHVAYRASGADVIVLTKDPGAMPQLFFGFPDKNRAVVAFLKCTMVRFGTKASLPASAAAAPAATANAAGAAVPAVAPPAGPANAVLEFQAGVGAPGQLTPLANVQFWVTPENPANALLPAGFTPGGGLSLSQFLNADCRDPNNCARDVRAMTGKALGSVRTDAAGHASTPHIPSGRYYIVGFAPYNGKPMFWSIPVDARPGSSMVRLSQANGTAWDH
jgi:hypothetical protein